jgi:hypothetical protein
MQLCVGAFPSAKDGVSALLTGIQITQLEFPTLQISQNLGTKSVNQLQYKFLP